HVIHRNPKTRCAASGCAAKFVKRRYYRPTEKTNAQVRAGCLTGRTILKLAIAVGCDTIKTLRRPWWARCNTGIARQEATRAPCQDGRKRSLPHESGDDSLWQSSLPALISHPEASHD